MTAAEAISMLDDALAKTQQTIRLLRMATPPATGIVMEVSCAAAMSGYQPSDMVPGSGIEQQDQRMILSPTQITAAGWPGADLYPVPRKGDRVISARGTMTIQACVGIYLQDTLVRIEAQVRGA